MARELELNAVLNFNFADHAEMTSTRTQAINFAATHSGSYSLITNEDPSNTEMSYHGKLEFLFPVADRPAANTIMTAIDNALSSLPDLVLVSGFKLRYWLDEKEV